MGQVKRIVTYLSKTSWIITASFFLISVSAADTLKIKINKTELNLPYWHTSVTHYGGVILVKGGEQSQSVLLEQFANQLAHYGWSVVLLNNIKNEDIPWVKQLPKVISTLRQEDNKRIVLIHYGDELNQSLAYFTKPQSKMINGLVMISAYDSQPNDLYFQNLRFPLFDIAGQFDYEEVLNQRSLRAKELKQFHYVGLEMPGANHDYEYSQRLLLAFTHGWMSKLPEIEIATPSILVSYIEPIVFLPSFIASISGFSAQI